MMPSSKSNSDWNHDDNKNNEIVEASTDEEHSASDDDDDFAPLVEVEGQHNTRRRRRNRLLHPFEVDGSRRRSSSYREEEEGIVTGTCKMILSIVLTGGLLFPILMLNFWENPSSSPSAVVTITTTEAKTPSETSKALQSKNSPPPSTRRDESMYTCAGVAPPGWPTDIIRQSETSNEALIDPCDNTTPNPYGWLRDDYRNNSDVLQHLHNENNYTAANTMHLQLLQDKIYNEYMASIQETDYTYPRPEKDYYYYQRTYKGKSYAQHCRAFKTKATGKQQQQQPNILWDGAETETVIDQQKNPILENEVVYLDENIICHNKDFCSIGDIKISPSQQLVAYTADFLGYETYELYVKKITNDDNNSKNVIDSETDTTLIIRGISDNVEWGNDDNTIFYLKQDDADRPFQLYRKEVLINSFHNNNDHDDADDNNYGELLYEENDILFWVGIWKSLDKQYLFMATSSTESSEVHFIKLRKQQQHDDEANSSITATDESNDGTHQQLHCIATRRAEVLYDIDHQNGMWWITSNAVRNDLTPTETTAEKKMRIFVSPAIPNSENEWRIPLSGSGTHIMNFYFEWDYISIDGLTAFENHVVVEGRQDGLPHIWILFIRDTGSIMTIESPSSTAESIDHTIERIKDTTVPLIRRIEPLKLHQESNAYDIQLGPNYEYNTNKIAVYYQSLITPKKLIEINFSSLSSSSEDTETTILQQKFVPKYDGTLYDNYRIMVPSPRDDGILIPVSFVGKKELIENIKKSHQSKNTDSTTTIPMMHFHLYAYGTYGDSIEDDFSISRLPLINRNIVYTVIHVRGGGEMGKELWYKGCPANGGKYLCKKNTFYDFIDVTKYIIETKVWTKPEYVSCEGRSAGGMTISASINIEPELFRVAILGVPFVDLMATMIDASVPLTAGEWEEWGNPNEMKYFEYMKSYSPMDNINVDKKYPSYLLLGGLHDPRVAFWEPAKFAATLRYFNDLRRKKKKRQRQLNGKTNNSSKEEEIEIEERPVYLKVDMTSGHFSASDRYEYYKRIAFDYAFLLDQVGLADME